MMKRILITSLAAATISTLAIVAPAMFTPAAAQAYFNMSIGVPAPAYYYEPIPVPQVGYVWAPGYWRWEHDHRYWERGHWYRHGWDHGHR
ncbi:MAG: YXWGXW repeat-containing protein [Reyranellales bacterium]